MGLRLRLLDALLRQTVKRHLRAVSQPESMRRALRRGAALVAGSIGRIPESSLTLETEAMPPIYWRREPGFGRGRAILYLHGGAFVCGSPLTHRAVIHALARGAGVAVAAVDYRLAPEHPFPAALEDAVTSYRLLLDSGLRGAAIALAGDSAGGGLCFALAAELERSGLPRPAAIAAFSPWVDLALTSPSLKRLARHDAMLPVERFDEVVAGYLGDSGVSRDDPRVSPVYARFRDPPPTLIQVGSHEALRDDAVRMAETLRRDGGDVRLDLWRGAPHALPFFAPILPEARTAVAQAAAFLAEHLAAEDLVTEDQVKEDRGDQSGAAGPS